MARLYINGMLADITDDTTILISKQLTDYTNPTIVKNAFSKTVSLPATTGNERIFNCIWKTDNLTNPNFNMSKRIPFELYNNFSLIEKGYIKLDKIKIADGVKTYETTLYGELGNILYGLSYDTDGNKLNLSNLIYENNLEFTINRYTVKDAWDKLYNLDKFTSVFNTINFAVTIDNAPETDSFDPSKCFIDLSTKYIQQWDVNGTQQTNLPAGYDNNGNPSAFNTGVYKAIRVSDKLSIGISDIGESVNMLDMKDLRSYLLRPVIRISKILEAIGRYIKTKYNYEFIIQAKDLKDDAFVKELWMTLPLLYEKNKSIKSNDFVTQEMLLESTETPASYLVSIVKTMGLFIDIDPIERKMIIKDREQFYNDTPKELTLDKSDDAEITPLSFDKASYIFNYRASDTQLAKTYKEKYNVDYGIKKINTGFEFDSSASNYIDNNVFVQGVDTIYVSKYNRYTNRPGPYMFPQIGVSYDLGLFKVSDQTIETLWSPVRPAGVTQQFQGYLGINSTFAGYRNNLPLDATPKLDCRGVSGSNILVYFNGFQQVNSFTNTITGELPKAVNESDLVALRKITDESTYVQYNITDDLFQNYNEGKGCWLNTRYDDSDVAIKTNSLPMFNRNKYDFSYDNSFYNLYGSDLIGKFKITQGTITNAPGNNGIICKGNIGLTANARMTLPKKIMKGNKYLCIGLYKCDSQVSDSFNYPYIGGTDIVETFKFNYTNGSFIACGSICIPSSDSNVSSLNLFSTSFGEDKELYVSSVYIYNLTSLDLEDESINTLIKRFGNIKGTQYAVTDTLDFGFSKEIFIPNTVYYPTSKDIYTKMWKKYIEDLYSVNTRILSGTAKVDSIFDIKNIMLYDGSLWAFQSITDFDFKIKKAKVKLIKINDPSNYGLEF